MPTGTRVELPSVRQDAAKGNFTIAAPHERRITVEKRQGNRVDASSYSSLSARILDGRALRLDDARTVSRVETLPWSSRLPSRVSALRMLGRPRPTRINASHVTKTRPSTCAFFFPALLKGDHRCQRWNGCVPAVATLASRGHAQDIFSMVRKIVTLSLGEPSNVRLAIRCDPHSL